MNHNESLLDKEVPMRVAHFMKAGGQLVPDHPQVPSESVQEMRISLLEEELEELKEAYADENIEEVVDAGVDLAVVALGAALDAAPAQAVLLCLKAVLTANEAKIDPVTGEVKRREDGKVLKPEGWQRPDIGAILRLYGSDEASSEEVTEGISAAKEAISDEN